MIGCRVSRLGASALLTVGLVLASSAVHAQVVAAEPEAPIVASFPADAPQVETQVVLQLVIDSSGQVESAVVTSRAPANAPASFDTAALDAAKHAVFHPSTRDGRAIRSRIEYVVVFGPADAQPAPEPPAVTEVPVPASAGTAASVPDQLLVRRTRQPRQHPSPPMSKMKTTQKSISMCMASVGRHPGGSEIFASNES